MITEKALQEAIAECQGVRNPKADTCMKLAAYYTIQDHIAGPPSFGYSGSNGEDVVGSYGDSEFFHAIAGMDASRAWEIMGDLMDALAVLNPRLYTMAMSKLK